MPCTALFRRSWPSVGERFMARRVRQAPSRGSKKRRAPVFPKGVFEAAKTASLDRPGRNDDGSLQDGDVVESRINGLVQTSDSEQHDVADRVFSPLADPANGNLVVAESFDGDRVGLADF